MRRSVAVLAALVALAGESVAIAVSSPGTDRRDEAAVGAVVVAYAAVGLLIVWHRAGSPVGRIALLAAAAWGPGQALVDAGTQALRADPADRSGALASAVGSTLGGLAWLVLVLWLPLVFPDGTARPTRLRRTTRAVVGAALGCFAATLLLSPRLTRLEFAGIDSPIGLPHVMVTPMGALAGISLFLGVVSVGLTVACLVQQYRLSGSLGRQQTLIFGLAFVPPVLAFGASFTDSAGPWLFGLCTLPLPVAIGTAVLQRRLYDLPLVVNRSVTYGSLWLLIAALYALVVGGVGALLRQQGAIWLPWVAAGVVAVSFAPLRDGLQRAANQLTFGQWAQPHEVLDRTARRLADAGDVSALLDSLAGELATDLGLRYVEITGRGGHTLASSGERPDDLDELVLTAYGEPVGALRWRKRPLRDGDRALLTTVAAQLGSVVHADGLLASVRAAQERLVLAREEERRRLRRDLHDGLGPTLAALLLQVDTLRNTAAEDATRSGLLELRSRIQDTVVDVRRIVEGLRPAALDNLGLAEAIHQLAARFSREGLSLTVDVEENAGLPAAVEVAVYRIVQEAVTNAARHSGSARVQVAVRRFDGRLEVCVVDDGSGLITPRTDGVGLGSMRERAEEIGGQLEVVPAPGRGTTVRALLPIGRVRA
ncbi:sensor histidine kinase [Kribbella antiqua]|nr:sensor histidine kinase [Kribbella antiqua]